MKIPLLLLTIALNLTSTAFAQIKILEATSQRAAGGRGGIFMNYTIKFKNKKMVEAEIDSVKSIADGLKLHHYFQKNDNGLHEIGFSQALHPAEKCATCPDVVLKPVNLTKGIMIYYRTGENKSYVTKIKKFKQLKEVYQQ